MGSNVYNEIGAVTRGAYAGDRFTPWTVGAGHEGWANLDSSKRASEFLTAAGLDFEVRGEPLSVWAPYDLADEHKLVIGNGKVLGVHSNSYGIIQNAEVAEMIDLYVDLARVNGQEAAVHSMFSLDKDKVVAGCAYVSEPKFFGGGERQNFVSVLNAHDGSAAYVIWAGSIIIECTNTLAWSLASGSRITTIRHTSGAAECVEAAKRALVQNKQDWAAMDTLIERLLATPLYDHVPFVERVIGPRPDAKEGPRGTTSQTHWDNRFAAIVAEYKADHNEYARNTAWGGLMAVNGYELWGGRQSKTTPRPEKQFMSLASGDNGSLTAKALKLLVPA